MSMQMKNFSRHNPLIMALLFVGVLIYAAYVKLASWSGMMQTGGIAFMVLYVLWVFSEFKITAGEITKGASSADKLTCEAYAIARVITVACALAFPTVWTEPGRWMIVGMGIFVASIIFRLVAIYTLGKFYSHRVRITNDHQIIDSGPYRWIRHPAYTGMFLAHIGLVIFFFNWFVLIALFFVFLPVLVRRILVEEKALFDLPGYKEFALERARLIPLAW